MGHQQKLSSWKQTQIQLSCKRVDVQTLQPMATWICLAQKMLVYDRIALVYSV